MFGTFVQLLPLLRSRQHDETHRMKCPVFGLRDAGTEESGPKHLFVTSPQTFIWRVVLTHSEGLALFHTLQNKEHATAGSGQTHLASQVSCHTLDPCRLKTELDAVACQVMPQPRFDAFQGLIGSILVDKLHKLTTKWSASSPKISLFVRALPGPVPCVGILC